MLSVRTTRTAKALPGHRELEGGERGKRQSETRPSLPTTTAALAFGSDTGRSWAQGYTAALCVQQWATNSRNDTNERVTED